MWVKVDYSIEAKKNPRPNMCGQLAIYTKRHWWNKWIERDRFANVEWCTREAKKLIAYPKVFVNWFC